jgi:hypothetical protein
MVTVGQPHQQTLRSEWFDYTINPRTNQLDHVGQLHIANSTRKALPYVCLQIVIGLPAFACSTFIFNFKMTVRNPAYESCFLATERDLRTLPFATCT